jgi:hypothetical protein
MTWEWNVTNKYGKILKVFVGVKMGSFSQIENKLKAVIQDLNGIVYDVNKLRGVVKDSKREKVDDIQRQLNKLQERLDDGF